MLLYNLTIAVFESGVTRHQVLGILSRQTVTTYFWWKHRKGDGREAHIEDLYVEITCLCRSLIYTDNDFQLF